MNHVTQNSKNLAIITHGN